VSPVALAALVSREWRTSWADRGAYILRGAYAGALLVGAIAAWVFLPLFRSGDPENFPELIRSFFGLFCRGQFVLATLLAAMTFARAVCREQERGTMDLLILSPLSRMEILLGKVAGEFLGLTAFVASGIPVLFLLIPLGGLSAAQILSLQGTVLAQVLLVGGVCVALAAAMGRTLPVMLCAWTFLAAQAAAPSVGRWWSPGPARVLNFWEALSIYEVLERQLSSVWSEPAPALKALGLSAVVAIVLCALGSLLLERRLLRGARAGMLSLLAARVRRFAGTLSGQRLFRHLVGIDHPLMRRECAVYRDLPFRFGWIVLMGAYGLAVRIVLERTKDREEDQIMLAAVGLAAGSLIAILTGALSVGYDRRRGTLQMLLAAGVAPEDLVRARLAGLVLRAAYLLLIPALHLTALLLGSDLFTMPQLAWRIPAGVFALVLGTILMMGMTLKSAISHRRPEVSAVISVFFALPVGVLVMSLVAGTLPTFAIGFPLMIGALLSYYARLVRKAPLLILR
jgi:ABC-type transport system involved in multi-copper enzyme maturation permease subunit